jgi:hypothetical protein
MRPPVYSSPRAASSGRRYLPAFHPQFVRRHQMLRRLQVWQLLRPYVCQNSPRRVRLARLLREGVGK